MIPGPLVGTTPVVQATELQRQLSLDHRQAERERDEQLVVNLFVLASVKVEFGDELFVFVLEVLSNFLLRRQPASSELYS